jgi:hypothetical protein
MTSILSKSDQEILFGNIDNIRTINRAVLDNLEKHGSERIGASFLAMVMRSGFSPFAMSAFTRAGQIVATLY